MIDVIPMRRSTADFIVRPADRSSDRKPPKKKRPERTRDGSSPEGAIIIAGPRRQYVTRVWEWIASNHPGCDMRSYDQALLLHDNRYFDSITITVSRGQRKTIYFGIAELKTKRV